LKIAALIVAAGRGTRAASNQGPAPKQYASIGSQSVLRRAGDAFLDHPEIATTAVIIHAADRDLYAATMNGAAGDKLLLPVVGGATRQASVMAGLEALEPAAPDAVLIHDAARPFVTDRKSTRLNSSHQI